MAENNIDSTNEYFKRVKDITKDLDGSDFKKLWIRAKKGDAKAKQRILEQNLRLVIPIAKKYRRGDVDFLDLVEEGNLGLLQAIERFEPKKGFKFSTYAVYWIEQHIRKFIDEQGGAIKIPSHAWGNIKRWTRAWNELKETLGREPTLTEMADEMELSARKVKSILDTINAAKGISSLAMMIGTDDEMTLEDTITDDGKGNPDDVLTESSSNSELIKTLNDLNPRDKEVLIMRYGLNTDEPMTLNEVSEIMGISRERVRQIEERAVNLIRKQAHRKGLIEIRSEAKRTQNIHTGMDAKHKTNVLGQIVGNSPLAKLLKQRMKQAEKNKPAKKAVKKQAPAKKAAPKKTVKKIIKKAAPKKTAKKAVKKVIKKTIKKPAVKPAKKIKKVKGKKKK